MSERLDRPKHYVVDGDGYPTPENDHQKWKAWIDLPGNRLLRQANIRSIRVLTVFLGIDCKVAQRGPPVLWQTKVIGGLHDGFCTRAGGKENL